MGWRKYSSSRRGEENDDCVSKATDFRFRCPLLWSEEDEKELNLVSLLKEKEEKDFLKI